MPKRIWIATLALVFTFSIGAFAQQVDAAFGVGTVLATSASKASLNYTPQQAGGGAFPVFSANFLFRRNFGVGGEIAWRGSQNLYQGYQYFRPVFYDVNAVWVPSLGKNASLELQAGIGAASYRFYNDFYTCSFTGCTTYTSDNHFMGHFGGGVRFYVHGNVFIRPEAHLYLIQNNNLFSGPWASRVGASIGYSFGRNTF